MSINQAGPVEKNYDLCVVNIMLKYVIEYALKFSHICFLIVFSFLSNSCFTAV